MPYLDDAVIARIQNRIESVLDRDALTARLRDLLAADDTPGPSEETLEARLVQTTQKIDRLVDAIALGADDLVSVRTRLSELERERSSWEAELGRARGRIAASNPDDLDVAVDGLLNALRRFPEVLAAGEPEERKAVVRAFLQEIRIEKTTRQAVLRWYRLPRVDLSVKLVELRGLEPLTPRLPALCSPN
jgi:hypothetical protein